MAVIRKWLMAIASAVLVGGVLAIATGLVTAGAASAAPASSAALTACYPPGSPSCPGTLGVSPSSVPQGGSVTVTGSGFAANSAVTIQVCTIETIHTTTDASGNLSDSISIPSDAPCGPCSITATGTGANGQPLVLSAAITITCAVVVPPTHTGEPWAGWLYWALAGGVGTLGYGLFEIGRRRRIRGSAA